MFQYSLHNRMSALTTHILQLSTDLNCDHVWDIYRLFENSFEINSKSNSASRWKHIYSHIFTHKFYLRRVVDHYWILVCLFDLFLSWYWLCCKRSRLCFALKYVDFIKCVKFFLRGHEHLKMLYTYYKTDLK